MSFARLAAAANRQVIKSLGTPVTLFGGTVIQGIFGNGSEAVDAGVPGLDYISPIPWVQLRNVDVPDLEAGDEILIEGTAYVIRELIPDSFGMTKFTLRLSAND